DRRSGEPTDPTGGQVADRAVFDQLAGADRRPHPRRVADGDRLHRLPTLVRRRPDRRSPEGMNPDVNPDVNCESATAESAAPTATGRPNRPLGRTGIEVTDIGVGTGELGDMTAVYGYRVDDERADAMLAAVLDGPFTMIDTSNGYGHGRSEERIGRALRAR